MKEKLFDEIYNTFNNDIYRLAYSYTQNKYDSEDITQKVFIKYLKNINKVSINKEEIKKWLITVTINECKDLFRTSWRKKVTINEELLKNEKNNKTYNIEELLEKLPQKYKIIFHLYYYYGYSTKEIAIMTNTKEETIRKRLSRGREKLKLEGRWENEKL